MNGNSMPLPHQITGPADPVRFPGLLAALRSTTDGLIEFPVAGCGYQSRDLAELQARDYARPFRDGVRGWRWKITAAGQRWIAGFKGAAAPKDVAKALYAGSAGL